MIRAMANDPIDDLIASLTRGSVVQLRGDLQVPAGRYSVVAMRSGYAKLRRGRGEVLQVPIKKLRLLVEFARGYPEGMGVMAAAGYSVAGDDLSVDDRRRLLEDLLHRPYHLLPPATGIEEWGDADTMKRFWKIARNLRTFAANAERRPSMRDAISKWEVDLEWFFQELGRDVGALVDINWEDPTQ